MGVLVSVKCSGCPLVLSVALFLTLALQLATSSLSSTGDSPLAAEVLPTQQPEGATTEILLSTEDMEESREVESEESELEARGPAGCLCGPCCLCVRLCTEPAVRKRKNKKQRREKRRNEREQRKEYEMIERQRSSGRSIYSQADTDMETQTDAPLSMQMTKE